VGTSCSFANQRYAARCSPTLRQASLDSALSQVGVKEVGKNDGKEVRRYLASVGLRPGNPYCAAGVYWSFEVARGSEANPLFRTGSTALMFNKGREAGLKTAPTAQSGDLVFWMFATKPFGHVGRIVSVGRAGWVTLVEFNTTAGVSGNQRDGGGVYLRTRNLRQPLGRMLLRGYLGFNS
jgi:hypothetical protein